MALRHIVTKIEKYSGSPYNGAVVQGKPPTTVMKMTVVGVTVIGNRPL